MGLFFLQNMRNLGVTSRSRGLPPQEAAEGPEIHGTDDVPFTRQLKACGSSVPCSCRAPPAPAAPRPPAVPVPFPHQHKPCAEGADWAACHQARPLGARLPSGLLPFLGTIRTIAPGLPQEQTQDCHTSSSWGAGRGRGSRCTPQALSAGRNGSCFSLPRHSARCRLELVLPCELRMRRWVSSEAQQLPPRGRML